MDYKVIDILRSPTVIVLDALLARRVNLDYLVGSSRFLGFFITAIGSCFSVFLYTCQVQWLIEFYRFMIGIALLILSTYLQTCYVASYYNIYHASHPFFNQSVLMSLFKDTAFENRLTSAQIDLTRNVLLCFVAQRIVCHIFFTKSLYGGEPKWLSHRAARFACSCASTLAVLTNANDTCFGLATYATLLPLFLALYTTLGKGYGHAKLHAVAAMRATVQGVQANGLLVYLENSWARLRIPQVLRVFFVIRAAFVVATIWLALPLDYDARPGAAPRGMYYYMIESGSLFHSIYHHHHHQHQQQQQLFAGMSRNNRSDVFALSCSATGGASDSNQTAGGDAFTFSESVAVKLTDSTISVFAISAALSVPLFYCGVHLHMFVGGADEAQAEALGMVSAILFFLLAIQTGLVDLPPARRLTRLYRNMCLLFAAVLHFVHDLVNPVLVNISAQVNIPVHAHVKPLIVLSVLFIIPTVLCVYLIREMQVSTWLVALVAFCIELIVKVLATFMLYLLFTADARIDHRPWPRMDDWVFYIQSTAHIIEFVCGCVMFVNGVYVFFFESGSILRAMMMSMHAYVNIYRAACDGWKTFNNRCTVNARIATLLLASDSILALKRDDVCSICYQDFSKEFGEVRYTYCAHLFHSSCLRRWLYIQETCPMCHQNIFGKPDEKAANDDDDNNRRN